MSELYVLLKMPPVFPIQTREYSQVALRDALSPPTFNKFIECLDSNKISVTYPIGWILGYSSESAKEPTKFKSSIKSLSNALHCSGSQIVFALIEWEDAEDWEFQRKQNSEAFESLGWIVSPPFAILVDEAQLKPAQ